MKANKHITVGVLLLATIAALPLRGGQPAQPVPAAASEWIADLSSATGLAHSGNLTSAEAQLLARCIQRRNTFAWDIEAATRLTHLAVMLRQRHDMRNARAAAERGVAVLTAGIEARGATVSALQLARGYESIGFIYERMLFDNSAARAAYTHALQVNPGSNSAQAALTRISQEEEARRRAGLGT